MAVVETLAVDEWIYSRLTADATLAGVVDGRIYNGAAGAVPQQADVVYPYVVFQQVSAEDQRYVGGARVWLRGRWLVKAVGEGGDLGVLGPIFARIDLLLDRQGGTVTGAQIVTFLREGVVQYAALLNGGATECHLGGIYRGGVQRTG